MELLQSLLLVQYTAISIGNTGSGYRNGVQTSVNVGVQTYGVGIASFVAAVGTATISNGHITSITITNTGTGYTDFVDDRLTTMTAVAVAGTTIVSVATTEGINPVHLFLLLKQLRISFYTNRKL